MIFYNVAGHISYKAWRPNLVYKKRKTDTKEHQLFNQMCHAIVSVHI